MPFVKGQARAPTAGRKKGTKNRATRNLEELFNELGYDPADELHKLVVDPATDTALRTRINLELMQYKYPKRKALEHTGEITVPVIYRRVLSDE